MLGLGAAGQVDGQRAAARHQPAAPERSVRRDVRHVPRSPQRVHVLHEPARRRADYSVIDEGEPEHRLESGLGRAKTGRFDGGWTVEMAIPFKSLRYRSGHRSGVGHPDAPRRSGARTSGRYLTPVPQNPRRPAGVQPHFARRHAGRPRSAAGGQEPRAEAVRDLAAHDRSRCGRRRSTNDLDGDIGGDVKYGVTAEPHRRLHRQHRLRAGRDRRAAGEPDALQPVLSGEARLLSRGPRHLRLRAAAAPAAASAPARIADQRRRTCSTAGASASTRAASSRSTSAAG